MNRIGAVKAYFERKDAQAPEGGRKVDMSELKALSDADREELGTLAAQQLGVSLDAKEKAA